MCAGAVTRMSRIEPKADIDKGLGDVRFQELSGSVGSTSRVGPSRSWGSSSQAAPSLYSPTLIQLASNVARVFNSRIEIGPLAPRSRRSAGDWLFVKAGAQAARLPRSLAASFCRSPYRAMAC